jgi:hypothetical protein
VRALSVENQTDLYQGIKIMTPNNIAKVNRRLKPDNMKIRCYGSGHALFDISGSSPEFMDHLTVADMSISTVDELAAICRVKDTRPVEQETKPEPARTKSGKKIVYCLLADAEELDAEVHAANKKLDKLNLAVRRYGKVYTYVELVPVANSKTGARNPRPFSCVTHALGRTAKELVDSIKETFANHKKYGMDKDAYDLRGARIQIGDTVVYGSDNGSTLQIGVVGKITDKFVYMGSKPDARNTSGMARREHIRVTVLEKA